MGSIHAIVTPRYLTVKNNGKLKRAKLLGLIQRLFRAQTRISSINDSRSTLLLTWERSTCLHLRAASGIFFCCFNLPRLWQQKQQLRKMKEKQKHNNTTALPCWSWIKSTLRPTSACRPEFPRPTIYLPVLDLWQWTDFNWFKKKMFC